MNDKGYIINYIKLLKYNTYFYFLIKDGSEKIMQK